MEAKFDQIARNHTSSIHNIEVQLGQLAHAIATKNQESFPSNTEINLREQVKVITFRSGKEVKSQPEIAKEAKNKEDDQ